MAETTLPNIFLKPAEFRTAQNDLLVVRKQNRIATTTPADARRKPIAQWGNLLDGLLLRLQEQVSGAARSVRVYGAIGDGVTDDTDAIQAAIDAVEDDGGGIVFFPLGDYLHTGFTPAANVRLVYVVGDSPETLGLLGADGDIAVAVTGSTPLYVKTGGTGTSGWVEIGGGDVELADLPDAAACSVLGRAANSSGVRADIAAASDDTVLVRRGGVLSFTSIDTVVTERSILEAVDFATGQTFGAKTDGPVAVVGTIGGSKNWTLANASGNQNTDFPDFDSGNGLRFSGDGGATVYTSSSQSATHLRIAISDLITIDPFATYLFECVISECTHQNSGNETGMALFHSGTSTFWGTGYLAGVCRLGVNADPALKNGTTSSAANANYTGRNALAIMIRGGVYTVMVATPGESDSFPSLSSYLLLGSGTIGTASQNGGAGLYGPHWVVSLFATQGATADSTATFRRFQLSRMRS